MNISVRFQAQWRDIGTGLKVKNYLLNAFETNHPRNAMECMREVFEAWKGGETSPYTWENLAKVLCLDVVHRRDVLEVMYHQLSVQDHRSD